MREIFINIIRDEKISELLAILKAGSSLITGPGFLFLLCLIVTPIAAGTLTATDGEIVERKSYAFPNYEEASKTTQVRTYATREEYDGAINDPDFEFEKLRYLSDGLKVTAYLYKPKTTGGRKYPAIIFNRGSTVRGDIAPELVSFFHRLAREGFVILAPLYRQSDGGEGQDEVGGRDVNDLMNIVPVAKSLDFVDAENLFLYGESRGGIMSYLAVKNNFPARAAAVFGAISDIDAYLEAHFAGPPQYRIDPTKIWPDYNSRKEEIIKSRSAIYWPEKLNLPLLIMHGGADANVNPDHSLNLAQRLQKLGKTYELLIYAQDHHNLLKNKLDRDKRVVAWFRKFISKP